MQPPLHNEDQVQNTDQELDRLSREIKRQISKNDREPKSDYDVITSNNLAEAISYAVGEFHLYDQAEVNTKSADMMLTYNAGVDSWYARLSSPRLPGVACTLDPINLGRIGKETQTIGFL